MTTVTPLSHSAPHVPHNTPAESGRMISLDVFRGLIMAAMVLVTNAGSWDAVYWPLKHADWNGVTPTDMIFPSFLFVAGVSMMFSFAARRGRGSTTGQLVRHVATRSFLLILLGLLLNGFPLYDLANLRIPGVLQRIGLCSLLAGLFYLALTHKQERQRGNAPAIVAAIAVLLAGYWALLRFVPVPGYGVGRLDQAGNLGAYIDRAVFGVRHLWFWGGQMWDPEGLLSTLTPTANMLLGILAGEWVQSRRTDSRKLLGLAGAGAALLLAGVALNPWVPINKKIWTDSFMLFSGGFSLLALALLSGLIDRRGWRWGTMPALVFGSNAILAFTLANMLNPLEGLLHFRAGQTLHGLVFQGLVGWMGPYNASLGYALAFVAVNFAILWLFYRKRVFLKL